MIPEIQDLKILPEFFEDVISGRKPFEIRNTKDRKFTVGEVLLLREWIGEEYTGRYVRVKVTYIMHGGDFGIDTDYAILGIKVIYIKK